MSAAFLIAHIIKPVFQNAAVFVFLTASISPALLKLKLLYRAYSYERQ
jgi:hypothetical protein